jgi:hypothetical protein
VIKKQKVYKGQYTLLFRWLSLQKEFFHTKEQYEQHGLDIFLEHVKGYLDGKRTVPVSQIVNKSGQCAMPTILFTFSDALLRMFIEDLNAVKKPYEVAIKYGLRGYSKGGVNGILYQCEEDTEMLQATDALVRQNKKKVLEDLLIKEEKLDDLRKVKIVHHRPDGKRVVGVYNTEVGRMIFLGFAQYKRGLV